MISKKIYKAINSGIREAGRPENLEKTADKIVKDIKARTTKGIEVQGDHGGPNGKFKELASSTIKSRRRKKLSNKTRPEKSNQTMTGDMVKSVKHTTTRNNINITVDSGNKKKLKGNQALGRNMLRLSKTNLKNIAKDVVSFIANKIEKTIK